MKPVKECYRSDWFRIKVGLCHGGVVTHDYLACIRVVG